MSKKKANKKKQDNILKDKDIKEKSEEISEKNAILKIKSKEKYKTIDELFTQSQPSSIYYTLLILSVFIVTCGLLLQNAPIVIGGMLVTPILTPILVVSMAISVAEIRALRAPLYLILKSTLAVIAFSTVITLIFGVEQIEQVFVNDLRTAILYFIVAAASGVAATFAWVRKEVSDILPGVSIAVSLVPPLSLIGINLGTLQFDTARFYLIIYMLNLFGIIAGSLIIFSLLRFEKSRGVIVQKVKEFEEIEHYREAKEKAKKAMEQMEQIKKNVSQAIEMEKEQEKKDENKDKSTSD